MEELLSKVKASLILEHSVDDELLKGYITAAVSYAESYQHIPEGYYTDNAMPATTEQAVIMLASHFYESRDGSTGEMCIRDRPLGQPHNKLQRRVQNHRQIFDQGLHDLGNHKDNLRNQGGNRGRNALGQRDDDLCRALHHSRKALDDARKQRGQHLHPGVYKLRQHGNRRVHQPRNGPGKGFIRPVHAVYHVGKGGDNFRDCREEFLSLIHILLG